jgi:hypothetical protein
VAARAAVGPTVACSGQAQEAPRRVPYDHCVTGGSRLRAGRAGWAAGSIVFVAVPWATAGLGTPVVFAAAAALLSSRHRAHASVLWLSAAVYAAAVAAALVSLPSWGRAPVPWTILIAVVGGGIQALLTVAFVRERRDPGVRDIAGAVSGLFLPRGLVRAVFRPRHLEGVESPGLSAVSDRPLVTALVIGLLAAACAGGGAVLAAQGHEAAAHLRPAGGLVTAVTRRVTCTDGCSQNFETTIRYRPRGGAARSLRADLDDSLPRGAQVRVFYPPGHPGDASLHPGSGQLDLGITLIAAGALAGLLLTRGVLSYCLFSIAARRARTAGCA